MAKITGPVTGGAGTRAGAHVAAAAGQAGRVLGTCPFPADEAGYGALPGWLASHGELAAVGVEGTGSYGAGLARYLAGQGVRVLEAPRPDRQRRRRHGKSGPAGAVSAALAAVAGEDCGLPKGGDGPAEPARALRAAREGAVKARTQAGNQLRDLAVTGPRAGPRPARRAQDPPPGPDRRRVHLRRPGRPGDNPGRITTEAAFAALCGASTVDCSSGKQQRHRLNRGGGRQASSALWRIAVTRIRYDPATQARYARRVAAGKTRKEIIRELKRYIARQAYRQLTRPGFRTPAAPLRAAA